MHYDFDASTDRRNTNSLKWNVGDNEFPMWVADMDFKTAPQIIEAVVKRANEGIFGYTVVPDSWYESIISWWKTRHQLEIEKDWLCFCTGVIPAISSMVKRLTNVGDSILVQTPVYDIFFHSIENAGRVVLENKLIYDGKSYRIHFENLEKQLSQPLTTLMILCNPHNPIGKIWSRDDLFKIGELCRKYGVTVISDEIHCDLTNPGKSYIPFASVSTECAQNSVTCISASKSFNIAGLQAAAVIVPDESIRNKVVRGLNSDEVAEPNCFAVEAMETAFNKGADWLDQLRKYLLQNKIFAAKFVQQSIPDIKLIEQEATYLLWLDCSGITNNAENLCKYIRKATGLFVTAGNQYRGNGKSFIRINIACQSDKLKFGLNLLKNGIEKYKKDISM